MTKFQQEIQVDRDTSKKDEKKETQIIDEEEVDTALESSFKEEKLSNHEVTSEVEWLAYSRKDKNENNIAISNNFPKYSYKQITNPDDDEVNQIEIEGNSEEEAPEPKEYQIAAEEVCLVPIFSSIWSLLMFNSLSSLSEDINYIHSANALTTGNLQQRWQGNRANNRWTGDRNRILNRIFYYWRKQVTLRAWNRGRVVNSQDNLTCQLSLQVTFFFFLQTAHKSRNWWYPQTRRILQNWWWENERSHRGKSRRS